jgi:hypothetical protein
MTSWIEIGPVRRDLPPVDEQWIVQQINGRRSDGQRVCIRVHIKNGDASVTFASAECGGARGRGGEPSLNSVEQALLDLWLHHGLNDPGFHVGPLIAFLKKAIR